MVNLIPALWCALAMFIAKAADHILGQPLIERPLVMGTLVGLFLGDPAAGIMIGAQIELIFMGVVMIGGSAPPDLPIGTVLPVAYAILSKGTIGWEAAVALSVPIALLGNYVYQFWKLFCTTLVATFDRLLEQGEDTKALRFVWFITLGYPTTFAVLIFFCVLIGVEPVTGLVNSFPVFVINGLKAAGNLLPAVGFAILLKMLWNKELAAFFFIGFAAAAYLKLGSLPIAILSGGFAVYTCFQEFNLTKRLGCPVAQIGGGQVTDSKEDFFNE